MSERFYILTEHLSIVAPAQVSLLPAIAPEDSPNTQTRGFGGLPVRVLGVRLPGRTARSDSRFPHNLIRLRETGQGCALSAHMDVGRPEVEYNPKGARDVLRCLGELLVTPMPLLNRFYAKERDDLVRRPVALAVAIVIGILFVTFLPGDGNP